METRSEEVISIPIIESNRDVDCAMDSVPCQEKVLRRLLKWAQSTSMFASAYDPEERKRLLKWAHSTTRIAAPDKIKEELPAKWNAEGCSCWIAMLSMLPKDARIGEYPIRTLSQDGKNFRLDDVCVPAGPLSNECTNINLKRKGEENQNLSGECFPKRLKAADQLWDQHSVTDDDAFGDSIIDDDSYKTELTGGVSQHSSFSVKDNVNVKENQTVVETEVSCYVPSDVLLQLQPRSSVFYDYEHFVGSSFPASEFEDLLSAEKTMALQRTTVFTGVIGTDEEQIAAKLVKHGPFTKDMDHGVLLVGYRSAGYAPSRLKEKPMYDRAKPVEILVKDLKDLCPVTVVGDLIVPSIGTLDLELCIQTLVVTLKLHLGLCCHTLADTLDFGEMAEQTKTNQFRHGAFGVNFTVKVVDSKVIQTQGLNGTQGCSIRLAECLVADETKILVFTARNEQDPTPEYSNLGDFNQVCEHCGTLFGYNEWLRRHSKGRAISGDSLAECAKIDESCKQLLLIQHIQHWLRLATEVEKQTSGRLATKD
ncbi:nucleic acid-binding, OB-fold protein [Artemisia annua]|uniref:Nucleic acid-binding, OB-fold protein n=1 Tax=Artemisia annua TaxID=35608 RepID=A0A2U1LJG3_ARTAN|nr:nucleic acid-binding, OB-fold protein [Artemisia annua]